jgi:predicted short-subunit dehydrogenase-like oxidoreductase (DUF2520 family)
MNVSIIGSGNLATHLALALENAGVIIDAIYSRNVAHAQLLCSKLYSTLIKDDLDFSDSPSQIFIICVSDKAIATLCSELKLPTHSFLYHTAGSVPIAIIEQNYRFGLDGYGVLYPLMSFSKNVKINFQDIPFCLEYNSEHSKTVLLSLTNVFSKKVFWINSSQREALHIAAVFANNFTNHLLGLSKEICEEEKIDFQILKPIVSETIKKAFEARHPAEVQTGPALRRDQETIDAHMEYLSEDDDLSKVYATLTESIIDWHIEK